LIGVLILLIARILEIVAYFSLPDEIPKATQTTPTTPAPE